MSKFLLLLALNLLLWYMLTASAIQAQKSVYKTSSTANTKSKGQIAAKKIEPGRALIEAYGCLDCHQLDGKGAQQGVSLDKPKLPQKFIVDHILDPEGSVERHADLFKHDPNMMPQQHLSKEEAEVIAKYLFSKKSAVSNPKKQVNKQIAKQVKKQVARPTKKQVEKQP